MHERVGSLATIEQRLLRVMERKKGSFLLRVGSGTEMA